MAESEKNLALLHSSGITAQDEPGRKALEIAEALRNWAVGDSCDNCPALDDTAALGAEWIEKLLAENQVLRAAIREKRPGRRRRGHTMRQRRRTHRVRFLCTPCVKRTTSATGAVRGHK